MAFTIEAGWDHYRDAGQKLHFIIVLTSGQPFLDFYRVLATYTGNKTLSHSGFDDYLGPGRYESLSSEIERLLGDAPISVQWDSELGAYTFALTGPVPGVTGISIQFPEDGGAETARLLGFSGDQPTALSHTSDVTPLYWFEATHGETEPREDFEPGDVSDAMETNGGRVYIGSQLGIPVQYDFTLACELEEQVFSWKADYNNIQLGTERKYTIQDHFEHCRAWHPFLVNHDTEAAVHQFRPEEAFFDHRRVFEDKDTHWDVLFRTYITRRF